MTMVVVRGRKGPGGSGDLQNRSDLPMAGWVGSIPTRSRHADHLGRHECRPSDDSAKDSRGSRGRRQRRSRLGTGLCVLATVTVAAASGQGQQQDSARAGVARPAPTEPVPTPGPFVGTPAQPAAQRGRPPVSPTTALLSSFVLPGYGQARLDRAYAGALFFSVEAFSFVMLRQAEIDLRYAEAHLNDSTAVVQTYQINASGQPVRDSLGNPIPATYAYARYDSARVRARKTHVEDWIAAILFNHLISGADAFVAAQLWDLTPHVRPMTGSSLDGRQRLFGLSVFY